MTAQDKLNKAARAHGWANWSEVLMHNAPAHVINLIVEEAMRGEPVGKPTVSGQLPNNLILYRQAKKLDYTEFCKWLNAKLGDLR